jgi:hypothetical protein
MYGTPSEKGPPICTFGTFIGNLSRKEKNSSVAPSKSSTETFLSPSDPVLPLDYSQFRQYNRRYRSLFQPLNVCLNTNQAPTVGRQRINVNSFLLRSYSHLFVSLSLHHNGRIVQSGQNIGVLQL